jgi:fatty-acid peroxygenase
MDLAWKLWRDGYRAIPEERAGREDGDAFECRLLGRRALVLRGPEGARAFYDPTLVRRAGAIPPPLAALLFGRGAVHGLDDEQHLERKRLFLDLLTAERLTPLVDAVSEQLGQRVGNWRGRVLIFDELAEIYGAAMLSWVGVAVSRREARRIARRLAWIVDGFGFAPGAYLRAWACRLWADRWARRLVDDVRRGRVVPPSGSPLAALAATSLPAGVAGVELINLLRPTVAIAWPGTFAAHALAEYPQWRGLLEDRTRCEAFAHEVRRRYPFVPALAGRARRAGAVLGHEVREGQFLVLDVDGTDHDPTRWEDPEGLRPERFAGIAPDAYSFVPQGGGDPRTGHRCPGEPLTVRLLAATVRALAQVPFEAGPTSYPFDRIPTLPRGELRVRTSG